MKYPRPTSKNQPTTGARCTCRPGVQRDNCPTCEGTGWVIDFAAIRNRPLKRPADELPERDFYEGDSPDY